MPRMLRFAALSLVAALIVAACGDADPAALVDGSANPSPDSSMAAETMDPEMMENLDEDLCANVDALGASVAGLIAVELRLPNRVALDIELGKVQSAYSEVRQADIGELKQQLEDPLTRLGYTLGELELAVEDFRTNSRPRRAAPHVEEDSAKFSDALSAFTILARC
jgi:hypothetical protein